MASSPTIEIVGRSSSHFTRVAMIYAHELGLPFERVVVNDLTSVETAAYGGHPALKIPTLRIGASAVFGTENICRRLVEHAGRAGDSRIVWPERVAADTARCAQELTWHAMGAQVQLVAGTLFAKLPPENVFFVKIRAGLEGALAWLDANLTRALDELPQPRDLSLLEVTLFCLVEHLTFRPTLPAAPPANLRRLAAELATRASARQTEYRYDSPPDTTKE